MDNVAGAEVDHGYAEEFDELLREARERLAADTGRGDLGEGMTPEAGSAFRGRWRGESVMQTQAGERQVFLVWDEDCRPGFLYAHARLVAEVDEQRPSIGDRVLVLRGDDESFVANTGDERTIFPYALVVRPCVEPLPDRLSPIGDEDIPFAPAH
jgi:hypothetical protein